MSIFGNIMSSIFGHGAKAQTGPAAPGTAPSPVPASGGGIKPAAAKEARRRPQVDVEAVLTRLATQNKEKLDWRKSIVDLMKLLKLDSGPSAPQGARQGAAVHRRYERFRHHEYLAAQAGDDQARRKRRQGPSLAERSSICVSEAFRGAGNRLVLRIGLDQGELIFKPRGWTDSLTRADPEEEP